jgi:hypothetical protein
MSQKYDLTSVLETIYIPKLKVKLVQSKTFV